MHVSDASVGEILCTEDLEYDLVGPYRGNPGLITLRLITDGDLVSYPLSERARDVMNSSFALYGSYGEMGDLSKEPWHP